jgi:photosystem II stability/assembly factor-like uncharacterized protein
MTNTRKLLIGTRKGLVVFSKSTSGKWRFEDAHFLGIPVTMTHTVQSDNSWWVCLDHGHWGCKIHISKDEGRSWDEVSAPVFPVGEEVKQGVPASLNYLWSMTSVKSRSGHRIFVGTEPGGLFVSKNGGISFELVRGLWDHPSRKEQWFGGGMDHPGIHSILIDPDNSQHMYVAISCAGVFETLDGGNTWVPKNRGLKADFLPDPKSEIGQDPHLLVACESNPKVMWQQNHCGIFRTEDGGDHWKDISDRSGEANFGFAIAADANNEKVAWVVPALSDESRVAIDLSLCVCRTENGGRSWDTFRKGLPQGGSFDITYRHALDQDDQILAFGTTTGNLYLSNDAGESWLCLSNNLPMVHCVEFI